MAKQSHISRKELEQDQTLETLDHIFFWISHNRNKILGAMVLVAAAFLIIGFVRQRQESRLAAASDELFHAFQVYENTLQETPYASEERSSGMTEVRQLSDQIISGYEDTPVARNALFLKGNAYYFEGDDINERTNTDAAIEVFQQYAAEAEDEFEEAAALMALGYANENLSVLTVSSEQASRAALESALDYYDQIIAMEDIGFLKNEAKLAKARLLASGGKNEEAIELYKEVLREEYEMPEEPGRNAPQQDWVLYNVKQMATQFSLGNTARIQLRRLGVDTEQLLEEIQAEQAAEAES